VSEPWTIKRVLAWAADDLRERGGETPRLDAELLLAQVLGASRIQVLTDPDRPLAKEELAGYRELHKRRRQGEPVAYLLGVREFYGRAFRVDKRVLVPRPDTETLVDVALERTTERSLDARVLDLCTGSGCVAITLACERPTWSVLGTDVSEGALEVARDNAARLGAAPRAYFQHSNLFDAIVLSAEPGDDDGPQRRFDLVTANPPYIAESERDELPVTVRAFEPHLALFAGPDGFDLIRAIVARAPDFLEPEGVLALEVGAGQAPRVAELLTARGFSGVDVRKDYGGIERVVSGIAGAGAVRSSAARNERSETR
jgi:release factor glutamine methyltransferase